MRRLLTTITIALGAAAPLAFGSLIESRNTDGRDELNLDLRSLWSKARPRSSPPYQRSLEELAKRDEDDSIETDPNGQDYLWRLSDTYAGTTFFDEMRFWDTEDPTNGLVHYVNRERSFAQNLTYFLPDGTVVMQSDMVSVVPPGGRRESVRIETTKIFNGGLFILDLKRAPWGCAVWPAYWTTAPNDRWPLDGEIDILEGTHDNEHNQVTWHTSEGCELDLTANFTGTPEHHYENNSVPCTRGPEVDRFGCGVVEWSRASYGAYFEEQGGGVIAMKWDEFGIAVWSFFRAAIPQDLTAGIPTPSEWGPPSAILSPSGCNITEHFRNHVIIFDITFCGDLAGNNYVNTECPGTCAERIEDPANFINSTWHINSLKVYQKFPMYARLDRGGNGAAALAVISRPYLSSVALLSTLALLLSYTC